MRKITVYRCHHNVLTNCLFVQRKASLLASTKSMALSVIYKILTNVLRSTNVSFTNTWLASTIWGNVKHTQAYVTSENRCLFTYQIVNCLLCPKFKLICLPSLTFFVKILWAQYVLNGCTFSSFFILNKNAA